MSESTLRALPKINGFSVQRVSLLPLLAMIAAILVVSLFFVWSRVEVIGMEYELSRLETNLRDAGKETARLRLEAASLSSPERIEQVARQQLGLRLPTVEQVITVD
ncbi:MAG: cell division protein FtsL [Desulfuromonadales bacterium]|nr:cell division protein FtsL [Desulfuromonadales bacterium]